MIGNVIRCFGNMRITDYEGGRTLRDVAITLTWDEAEELAAYLTRLMGTSEIQLAHLSKVKGAHLEQELTIAIQNPCVPIARSA